MTSPSPLAQEPPVGPPRWRAFAIAAAVYTGCVALATWPRVLWFRSGLPCLGDTLQHLWIMRWYKTCLLEGRSFVLCPEIQYPTGAPLGCFSPLHFQSLLYIPLSLAIRNDVLCYNLLWLAGIVFTGLASFLLIGEVVRDRWCAGFGGMLAMLSGPMMLHAIGHLELIYLGGFPLFLWAWIWFIDAPTRPRLAAAVGLYVLLAVIAAYYAVFAIFPAGLYVIWKASAQGLRGAWPWTRERIVWFLAFCGLVVPLLLLDFSNTLWAIAHGYVFDRPLQEFKIHGAPLWSYVLPTTYHTVGRLLPATPYKVPGLGERVVECGSYLGVVSLALIGYAAACRVRFPKAAYWWLALGVLVLLSTTGTITIGGQELALPSLWLKKKVLLFRLIRVPARFNLFAAVVAGLLAATGLQHLLARIPRRSLRIATMGALAAIAVADLGTAPAFVTRVPEMPGCYGFMERTAPGAAFVEVPQFSSGGSYLYAICGYWQSLHRGKTNAGYSGQSNAVFDNLLTWNSPFAAARVLEPDYLADPERVAIDVVDDVRFVDYAWLYLTAHRFRFLVLHEWPGANPNLPLRLDRLKAALAPAQVYEGDGTIVYDRDRLPRPQRPVVVTMSGWRPAWEGKLVRAANRQAHLTVYNPDPGQALQVRLSAVAFRETRRVRLLADRRELATWDVQPGRFQTHATPPLHLRAGVQELVVESDADVRPRHQLEASLVGDRTPYSLKVEAVSLRSAPVLRK